MRQNPDDVPETTETTCNECPDTENVPQKCDRSHHKIGQAINTYQYHHFFNPSPPFEHSRGTHVDVLADEQISDVSPVVPMIMGLFKGRSNVSIRLCCVRECPMVISLVKSFQEKI